MNCRGLHCSGCGSGGGGGPVIGIIVALVILAVIASKAKAIGHAAAEVVHVLVLVAITGVSIALAGTVVIVGLAVHRRLNRIDRTASRTRGTLTGRAIRELPEPRAELPARADLPAEVRIHPPREVECPYPSCHHNVPDEMLPVRRRPAGGHR